MSGHSGLVVTGVFGARCGLCWEAFRIGDVFTSVWRRGAAELGKRSLALNLHRACFEQLDPGDLTRLFGALEARLALPIAVLNGGPWTVDRRPFQAPTVRRPRSTVATEGSQV